MQAYCFRFYFLFVTVFILAGMVRRRQQEEQQEEGKQVEAIRRAPRGGKATAAAREGTKGLSGGNRRCKEGAKEREGERRREKEK